MPTEDFNQLMAEFSALYTCGISLTFNSLFACTCSAEQFAAYPNFYIVIDKMMYVIAKENYITIFADQCIFKIMKIIHSKLIQQKKY